MIERKIMLLGEMGVGKTSIANRLAFDRFSDTYEATIGGDIYHCEVEIEPGGARILFHVWDTDGSVSESIFKSVHLRGSQAAIVISDAKRPRTIDAMARMARLFDEHMPGRYLQCAINKVDLLEPGEEVVLPPVLTEVGLQAVRTSAKTGHNVTCAFRDAGAAIIRRGL